MKQNIRKIFFVFLISLVTLGLLLGIYMFYDNFFIKKQLSSSLENSPLINRYELGETSLLLHLNRVDNLPKAYLDFLENNKKNLKNEKYSIQLISNPNKNLENFYEEINPIIYEAIYNHNYANLQQYMKNSLQDYQLTKLKLFITDDYLFLQMEDKDFYFYKIFNLKTETVPLLIN